MKSFQKTKMKKFKSKNSLRVVICKIFSQKQASNLCKRDIVNDLSDFIYV